MEPEKKKRQPKALHPKTDFPKYVGEVFTQRLKDLGISRYRFICDNVDDVNRVTAAIYSVETETQTSTSSSITPTCSASKSS